MSGTSEDPTGNMGRIFVGPNGIRAGWRLLMFFAMVIPLTLATQWFLKRFPTLKAAASINLHGGPSVPLGDIVVQGSALVPMLFVAWLMSRIERRPFGDYGLPSARRSPLLLVTGAFWGMSMEACTILLIFAFHGYSFGTLALDASGVVRNAIWWAIAFVFVGLEEEFSVRGYVLFTLASGIRFWPAALVTSVLFGAAHLANGGETWAGAVGIMIWALVVCLTVQRTGSLWFAVGLHAADDFTETFLFSVNNSGNGAQGQLLHSTMHGPAWLTGGTVGPEGSIFAFLTTVLFGIGFYFLYPRSPTTDTTRPA
jgi:membrane protease YdiL (CAAX protease family)